MIRSPRSLKIAAAIIAVFAAVWFAVNVYIGKRAEARLLEIVEASHKSNSYRLRNLNHQRGMLASHGYLDLLMVDTCDTRNKPEWLTTRINYRLRHSVFPLALMHIEWSVEPLGQERAAFERLFVGQARLSGQGKVGLTGDVLSDMNLPEIQWAEKGIRLTVSPSTGSVALGDDTLKLDWRTPKISVRGYGAAAAIDGLGMTMDLSSARRGLGRVAFTIDKIGASDFMASSLSLVTQMREQEGRMDIDVTPSMKLLDAGGKKFNDLVLDFGIHGLHNASTEHLLDLAQATCDFRNLTRQEKDILQQHVRTLLFEGFSIGISRLAGSVDGDQLAGKWQMILAKTQGDHFSLQSVLSSQGELSLSGKNIPLQQKNTIIALGLATATPEGMRASYEFAQGILKVNGKLSHAAWLDTLLNHLDEEIRSLLTGQQIRSFGGGTAEEDLDEPSGAAIET